MSHFQGLEPQHRLIELEYLGRVLEEVGELYQPVEPGNPAEWMRKVVGQKSVLKGHHQ